MPSNTSHLHDPAFLADEQAARRISGGAVVPGQMGKAHSAAALTLSGGWRSR